LAAGRRRPGDRHRPKGVPLRTTLLALLTALGVAAGSRAASAADTLVPAADAASATLVTGGNLSGVYHRLEPGGSLDFATTGPATLIVEVRRRLPAVGDRPPGVKVRVLGDGALVMELVAGQPAVAGTRIHDGRGGTLSGPDRATVTVPAGGERLTLEAPAGGTDLLVQVKTDAAAD